MQSKGGIEFPVGGLCELLHAVFGKLPKQYGTPMQVVVPSHVGAARVAIAGTGAAWSVAPRCGRGLWHLWRVLVWHHLHRRSHGWRRIGSPRPFPLATHDGKSGKGGTKTRQADLARNHEDYASEHEEWNSKYMAAISNKVARLGFYPAESFF